MIPRSRKRLLGLYAITLAMLVVLGGRLWFLQVLNTGQYKALAQVNQTRTIVVPAVRGTITDDTGAPLVDNQTSMTVAVNMMQLSQTTSDDGKAVLARLAPLLHMPGTTLADKVRLCTRGVPQPCWTGSPYQPIPVAENVSDAVALQIMEEPTLYPGRDRAALAGRRLPHARRREPFPGPRLPPADHPGRDGAGSPAGDRVRRR
jgi:penicillin-binding protein 2